MNFQDFDTRVVRLINARLATRQDKFGELLRVEQVWRQTSDGPLMIGIGRDPKATGINNVEAELSDTAKWLEDELSGDRHFTGIIVHANHALLDQARLAREHSQRESDTQNFRSVKLWGGKNG